jgi:T5SS/PEP-CTERM-associated repeat protein
LVTGSGSQWTIEQGLDVGDALDAAGSLNIENGGVVVVNNIVECNIAYGSSATGIVTVTGSGSQLTYSGLAGLLVGRYGQGTLNVAAGGVVTDEYCYIGKEFGSTGAVTVTGSGSRWNNATELNVGVDGSGTLNVENGGVVTNAGTLIGWGSGSSGVATVTGIGSQWNNTGHLYVGSFGNGTLNVTAGGVVSNTVGSIAQENGSLSAATVSGSGSQWNNSNILVVGNNSGNGTLNVTAGAWSLTPRASLPTKAPQSAS